MQSKKRRGRPPAKLPKIYPLNTRLDEIEEGVLQKYCAEHKKTRTEAISEAIYRLSDQDYFWSQDWRKQIEEYEERITDLSKEMNLLVESMSNMLKEMAIKSKLRSDLNEEK
ncbi:hypothetical protein [Paenibacillus woosongensis]|uniref:Ribbon-helix-helix protein CopG domain-containing protein n=1 Tax=Paenibacillus woosongensis TaxID=307580 RepID=A0ABQ4MYV8_9BACL|nr:hypothetical protein [Paenibacillus woosongensis]GIP61120.1 hypothetical protein J15TS10_49340 [Paenibacillus woosongensis]